MLNLHLLLLIHVHFRPSHQTHSWNLQSPSKTKSGSVVEQRQTFLQCLWRHPQMVLLFLLRPVSAHNSMILSANPGRQQGSVKTWLFIRRQPSLMKSDRHRLTSHQQHSGVFISAILSANTITSSGQLMTPFNHKTKCCSSVTPTDRMSHVQAVQAANHDDTSNCRGTKTVCFTESDCGQTHSRSSLQEPH